MFFQKLSFVWMENSGKNIYIGYKWIFVKSEILRDICEKIHRKKVTRKKFSFAIYS